MLLGRIVFRVLERDVNGGWGREKMVGGLFFVEVGRAGVETGSKVGVL